MQCPYCENDVNPGVSRCPSCGASIPNNARPPSCGTFRAPASSVRQPVGQEEAKSKTAYIILGAFLGGLGIHNFYAGYTGKGILQLLISLIAGPFTGGIAALAVEIWAVIEVCTVRQDANGVPFV